MLLGDAISYLKILSNKKSFWFSYILCYGLFNVVIALYKSNNPVVADSFDYQFIEGFISTILSFPFVVFSLLILTGKEIFGKQLLGNLWRVWVSEFWAGFFTLLGLLCFVFPGLLLAIRYIYAAEVALFEGSNTLQNLRKSRKLSSVNGVKVVLSCLLGSLLLGIAQAIIQVPIALINEAMINSFAMNYFSAVCRNLEVILWCTIVYSGYLDATALNSSNELKLSEE
tara:strand:- start:538 stop:1218 length:681 start_codon:yes stop_codon:yes gene_type:complete